MGNLFWLVKPDLGNFGPQTQTFKKEGKCVKNLNLKKGKIKKGTF